jgi:hypothetical protein
MSKNKYTFCTVQCIEAAFTPPEKEGGKPAVFTKVKVTACEDKPSLVGTEVSEYRSLSGGAAKYTMEALRNLGWTCNDITELEGVGSVSARGGIYTDTYDPDKPRTKCGIWPARKKVTVSGSAKKSFAAQFKKAAATLSKVEVTDENRAVERNALPDAPEPEPGDDCADPFAVAGESDGDPNDPWAAI